MTRSERLREATAAAIAGPTPERLIAGSRVVLAAFGIVAIWLDPHQPAAAETKTYALLGLYLVYALGILAAVTRLPPDPRLEGGSHVVDIAAFSVLMVLTEGPTSPFFVMFTFALLAATLRWNWQGTIATALVLVPVFVLMGVFYPFSPGADQEVTRQVIRGAYLVVAAAMLAYMGYLRERARQWLAGLADWSPEAEAGGEHPPVEGLLARTLPAFGARRAVVLWELGEEPDRHRAVCGREGCEFGRAPPGEEAPVTPERAFALFDAGAGRYRLRGERRVRRGAPLAPALVAEHGIGRAVVAPLRAEGVAGHLIVVDPSRMGRDLIALAEIVATRVAGEIQRHHLRQQLVEAAAVRERARLARDVHDGLLQALTAASLQLDALHRAPPEEAERRLGALADLVRTQQRRLRAWVEEGREAVVPFHLGPELEATLDEVARHWDCAAELEVDPSDARVPRQLGGELALMISEAVANSAPHGRASRVWVKVAKEHAGLDVAIRDDGQRRRAAAPGGAPVPEHGLPRSLRERVVELGGHMRLSFLRFGMELRVRIPLP